ncbi:hypothetical protein BAL199_28525 [alpha proteobacterium BAL199]|jgi:hypothetical protein|nr:hypothetical protein BAL199_28525 [alpha proteobacterium BAL199]
MDAAQHAIEESAAYTAYRIMNVLQHPWPFPHLLFDQLLSPDLLDLLLRIDIPNAAMRQHPPGEGAANRENHRFSVAVSPNTLQDVAAAIPTLGVAFTTLSHRLVVRALVERFRHELEIGFGTTDLALQPSMVLVEDRSGYELLPHTDVPQKALTLIVYLAADDADPSLGTELYAFRGSPDGAPANIMQTRVARHWFNRVTTVPYRPNHGLAFAPSRNTFHGVGHVQTDTAVRRILQFQLNVDAAAASRRP